MNEELFLSSLLSGYSSAPNKEHKHYKIAYKYETHSGG